jgi:D-3-phosphoglycerate dehydrogenase
MIKILANDGISNTGVEKLEKNGFIVDTNKIPQENLAEKINSENIEVVLVRSATQIRKDIIDKCPNLKIIGRGGVGMDNIDVKYAQENNIYVINTPSASSSSVAELVFAHLFGMVRYLYESNRQMPMEGDRNFKKLKKSYSGGKELSGKSLGIIGFGRIGQEVAKIGIGLGMKILAHDKFIKEENITLKFFNGEKKTFTVETLELNDVLKNSDFITLHVPKIDEKALIGAEQIGLMKTGAGIINTSRGGNIDETALMFSLDKKKLAYAGLDVFDNEPTPSIHLLMHNAISMTPHIGAATLEAQDRIGIELADQIISFYKK